MGHFKKHPIDSTEDHIGVAGAVLDNIIVFDSNGLPKDGGSKISDLAVTGHTHVEADITDLDKYTQAEVNNLLAAQDEASELATDTTNFNGILSAADDTIQKALDTIDNFSPSATSWGTITGTLSDQTDLQNALDAQDELSEMEDVNLTSPVDNNLLAYDTTSGLWINQTASEAGLAEAVHTHVASDITDFDTEVSNNTDVADNTSKAHDQNTDQYLDFGGSDQTSALEIRSFIDSKGQNNGLASLDAGGKVPSSQLPAIAITDVYVVADIPARDALSVEKGDVAKVSDSDGSGNPQTYIYDGTSWIDIQETSDVISVNGYTGVVDLDTDDVSEGVSNLYYTESRVSSNTDVAANTAARHTQNTDTQLRSGLIDTDASGNMDVTGELKIKVFRQASQPTLHADDFIAIWVDTDDSNKSYLLFRESSGNTLSVELA